MLAENLRITEKVFEGIELVQVGCFQYRPMDYSVVAATVEKLVPATASQFI